MSNLSKFLKTISSLDCNAFHPGLSCKYNCLYTSWNNLMSSLKILAPIILISLIKRQRNFDKTIIVDTFKLYLKVSGNTALGGTIGIVLCCLLQKILPEQFLWMKILISTYVSVYIIVFNVPYFQKAFSATAYQACLELIINDKNNIGRSIIESTLKRSLLYVLSNVIILHGQYYYNIKDLWLITSNQTRSDEKQDIENGMQSKYKRCHFHKSQSCQKYILNGVRNYFILGLLFDVVDFIKNCYKGHSQPMLIRSTAFFASYALLYKLTHCLLGHFYKDNDCGNHFVASCISGLSFLLHPNISLLNYSIIQAIQTIWFIIDQKCADMKSNNKLLEIVFNFPYAHVICPASASIAFFIYFVQSKHSATLIGRMIHGVTGNYFYNLRRIFHERLKQMS